jgi:hypothetical protein
LSLADISKGLAAMKRLHDSLPEANIRRVFYEYGNIPRTADMAPQNAGHTENRHLRPRAFPIGTRERKPPFEIDAWYFKSRSSRVPMFYYGPITT